MSSSINLAAAAAELPDAWRSKVLASVGDARVKVSRMDSAVYPDERHDHAEVLVVLDGTMNLHVDGVPIPVRAGQMVRVEAGQLHGVAAGSHGTLLIFNMPDSAAR
ncbi:MAG: cupin domain-containing protein [Arenimonas sp.]